MENADCKAALQKLCALFALSNLLQGEQWLGLITANEVAFAEMAVVQLCEALRPDIIALTDAFDIPDRVLNSTLGRHDGNVYEALYAAAVRSPLNMDNSGSRTFIPKVWKSLQPYLDTAFLDTNFDSLRAKM